MSKKAIIGIGLLGAWQDHVYRFADLMVTKGYQVDSMKHWRQPSYPECRIIAAWDDKVSRGKALADKFSCRFDSDLDAFLADPAIDAVIVCSPTTQHAEHIIRAANAGKHIFVEKAPFASLEGAYLARDAVKNNGVHFMVSSPMDKPRNRFAKKFVDEGKLGTISEIRFRLYSEGANHVTEPVGIYNKEENGGGAMIDFGQHGVHMLNWFLGMPNRTTAHFSYVTEFARKYNIEDNAVAVYEFENGAIGVVEAGWAAPYHECILDIFGTKGRMHIIGDDVRYSPSGEKTIFDDIRYSLDGGNTIQVPESDLPEKISFPLRHWIESILNDTPDERINIDEAVAWTEMLMAAYRSAGKGEPIL